MGGFLSLISFRNVFKRSFNNFFICTLLGNKNEQKTKNKSFWKGIKQWKVYKVTKKRQKNISKKAIFKLFKRNFILKQKISYTRLERLYNNK